ncbi:MAG: hypothetical protein ACR2N6_07570 [Miltoncostaeaceae bacterium]
MYQLLYESDVITLREQDGSGYLVRCCGNGCIETRVLCASGDISDPVRRTPEAFLKHHPDAAEVPGIGAALFRLSCSTESKEAVENGNGEPQRSQVSHGHLKPVLRAVRH